jgi:hypothetical protein
MPPEPETDWLPPVPARHSAPRPPLRERLHLAFEIMAWACTIVALLAFDVILILLGLAVWNAR